MLRDGFKDLNVQYTCIACGTKTEGKWVYEIETDTNLDKDEIIKGLNMWSAVEKDMTSARELVEKLVGKATSIKKGRIFVPETEEII